MNAANSLLIVLRAPCLEFTVPLLLHSISQSKWQVHFSLKEGDYVPPLGGSRDMCIQGWGKLLASIFTDNPHLLITCYG